VSSALPPPEQPIVVYITRTPFQYLRSHHSIIMAYHNKRFSLTSLQEIERKMEFYLHNTTTDVNLGYTLPTVFLTNLSHSITTVDHICTRSCGSQGESETAVVLYLRIALCLQFRSKLQDTILRLGRISRCLQFRRLAATDLATTQEQLAITENHLRALCLVHSKWQDTIKEIQSHNQTMPMLEGSFALRLVEHIFTKITELTDGLFQNGE